LYKWANIYAATTTIGGAIVIDADDIRSTNSAINITAAASSVWKTTSASSDLTIQSARDLTVTSTRNIYLVASTGEIAATSSDYISFATADTERMRILSGGNVGIKTDDPQYDLHVLGKCVTGDTLLPIVEKYIGSTYVNYVQVKDIQGDEYVLSLNEKTGTLVPEKILALMDMGVKPIYKLETEDGKTIRTTGNHPYLKGLSKKSAQSANFSRTAYNTVVLVNHPNKVSIANQKTLSSPFAVDKEKTMDGTGFEPVGSWVINQDRYHTLPMASLLYYNQFQNAKWLKVIHLQEGDEIAVASEDLTGAKFSKIKKITILPAEQVYDLSIENTHNFVANGIIAHNTYISTSLSVEGKATTTGTLIDFAGAGDITAASASTWKTTSENLTITSEQGTLFATGTDIRLVASTGGIHATSTAGEIHLAYSTQFRIATSSDMDILKIDDEGSVFLAKAMYQPVYGSDDGLVLYLPFSEGHSSSSANIAYDRSPYGNDGTLTGMPMPSRSATSGESGWTTTTGKFGTAVNFDGTDDYVNCGSDSSLNITDEITIEAWVKADAAASGNGGVVTKDNSPDRQFNIMYVHSAPGFGWRIWQNDAVQKQVIASITQGIWYYVVGVADGSYVRIYLNGVEAVVPVSYDGTIKSFPALDVHIGGYDATYFFNGSIDEVKIYNRALSSEEIKAHYLRGTGAHGVVLADKFRVINTTNNINFQIDGSGNVAFGQTLATTTITGGMNIDGGTLFVDPYNDYVGIGTTAPTKTFHVNTTGDIIAIFEDDDNAVVLLKDTGGAANAIFAGLKYNSPKLALISSPDDFSSQMSYLTVDTSSGDVGIGDTAPGARLSVVESSGELVDFVHGTTNMFTIQDKWRTRFATSSIVSFGSLNEQIIDNMEATTTLNWTKSTHTVTTTETSTYVKVGDQSLKITSNWGAEDEYVRKTFGSAQDWTLYERMGFWIYTDNLATSTSASTTHMLTFQINDPENPSMIQHNIIFQAEDRWQYEEVVLNATGTTARDGVTSIQFKVEPETTTTNFYIDHIRVYNENERASEFFVDKQGNFNIFSPAGIELTAATAGKGNLPGIKVGSAIMEVNQPMAVNVAGDVGINYDLYFAGSGLSQITSAGPLQISAGDPNHYENLTLTTGGTGDVLIDIKDSKFGLKIIGDSNLGYVQRTYPEGELEIRNTSIHSPASPKLYWLTQATIFTGDALPLTVSPDYILISPLWLLRL
jgi:hypothetical protein